MCWDIKHDAAHSAVFRSSYKSSHAAHFIHREIRNAGTLEMGEEEFTIHSVTVINSV